MKRFFFRSLMIVVLALGMSVPVLADTIRLKDGSVIRGQIVSFKNEQFTIMVGSGTRGRKSQITVYMEDVESIEFDGAGAEDARNNSNNANTQPSYQPPTNTRPTNPSPQPTPNNTASSNTRSVNRQPTNTQPSPSNNAGVTFEIPLRVKADNTTNGWTNSGFVVSRGQRIRITGSGRVFLGKDGTGREIWSTPDGLMNRADKQKLMGREATGGLIAVIGDDNDDFIFIGREHDFVAQRDGTLFLGVNEGNLSDNSGFFDVVIYPEVNTNRNP